MPQYRKLHTKVIDSFDFNDLHDDFTRLTWLMLPLVSCREGRVIGDPRWLKSKLFPMRADVSPDRVDQAMGYICDLGMASIYQVDGRNYYQITKWKEHQGSTTKEAKSNYPPPNEIPTPEEVKRELPEVTELLQTNSRLTPDQLQTNSVTDAVFSIQYSDADADADAERVTSNSEIQQPTPKPETEKRKQTETNGNVSDVKEILTAWMIKFVKCFLSMAR